MHHARGEVALRVSGLRPRLAAAAARTVSASIGIGHGTGLMPRWIARLSFVCALTFASHAFAQDMFEIQVYDPTVDVPGHGGLEFHLNYVADGVPDESTAVSTDRLFHATLEPSYGVTKIFEIGGYLQGAAGPGLPFTFGGAKLRAKVKIPVNESLDLAINGEVSYVPAKFEANVFGSEIRPIMEYRFTRKWLIDVNPNFDFDLAGKLAGQPQFEPCIALRYRLTDQWLLSLEYYAGLGSLTHVLPWNQEYQAPFIAADVDIGSGFGIHFGIGTGLTAATNPFEIKSILSKDF